MSRKKDKNFKESIKIILVGDSGVGKTSIINRYYLNEFRTDMESTQSMNFVIKEILMKGRKIQLNIWDTLGQEKYYSCNKLFIKNSNIVILVYDITRKNSFENLDFWYNCINNELGKDFSLGLAGNKFDLINQEEVSEEEGIDKAKVWGAHFSLLSAKSDKDGIDIYFEELVKKYLDISISLTEFVLLEQNGLEKTIKLDR
jgi:small GTP-binding protein